MNLKDRIEHLLINFYKTINLKSKLYSNFEYSFSEKYILEKLEVCIILFTNCTYSFSSLTIFFSIEDFNLFPFEIELRLDHINDEGEINKLIIKNINDFNKFENFIKNKFNEFIDIIEGVLKKIPEQFINELLNFFMKLSIKKSLIGKCYFEQDNIRAYHIINENNNILPIELVFHLFGSKTLLEVKLTSESGLEILSLEHSGIFSNNDVFKINNLFNENKLLLQQSLNF